MELYPKLNQLNSFKKKATNTPPPPEHTKLQQAIYLIREMGLEHDLAALALKAGENIIKNQCINSDTFSDIEIALNEIEEIFMMSTESYFDNSAQVFARGQQLQMININTLTTYISTTIYRIVTTCYILRRLELIESGKQPSSIDSLPRHYQLPIPKEFWFSLLFRDIVDLRSKMKFSKYHPGITSILG